MFSFLFSFSKYTLPSFFFSTFIHYLYIISLLLQYARDESDLVHGIVEDIWEKLSKFCPRESNGLVGIDQNIARIQSLLLMESSALCFMWLFGRMPLNTYFLPLCIVQGLIYLWFFTPLLEMRPQYLSTQLLTWSRQDYHIRQK